MLPKMYTEFAELWTLISDPYDYTEEALFIRDVLRRKLAKNKRSLLELGVGGGNLLSHLIDEFQATAIDISPQMLKQAKKALPNVELLQGDMRSIRLDKKYDVVLIHDAISYITNKDDLAKVFETAKHHLNKNGVLLTTPDWLTETFYEPYTAQETNTLDDITLTNFEYMYDPDPNDSMIECRSWYLINKAGKLNVHEDIHYFGLFGTKEWLDLMTNAGFEVTTIPYDFHSDRRSALMFVGVSK